MTSTTRWQSLRQRAQPFKQVVCVAAFLFFLSVYAYAFFALTEVRNHDRVAGLNSAVKGSKTKHVLEAPSGEAEDDSDSQGKQTSFVGNLLNWVLVIYSINVLIRFYARTYLRRGARQMIQEERMIRELREQRFLAWAARLNFQRQANGQPSISLNSLRIVMREREMTGDDYDNLLQFNEEAGPAIEAMLQTIGASSEEIERIPIRTLGSADDLLTGEAVLDLPRCAICLDRYCTGEKVRTLPCMHNFHQRCIDRWLVARAVCPVCKHPGIV